MKTLHRVSSVVMFAGVAVLAVAVFVLLWAFYARDPDLALTGASIALPAAVAAAVGCCVAISI